MMGRMVGGWKRLRLVQRRPFCTTNNSKDNRLDAYKQLDNLDFMTAAKILFTTPPKKKQFGIDFHLVQLFFVCMPSLAVYLVAQYARHEMRRMEAELEVKKRAEEEAKAKEMEIKAAEEKEAGLDPELIDVKERLGKLEDALKEIVVESKKQSGSIIAENKEGGNNEGKKTSTIESTNSQNGSKSSDSEDKDPDSKQTPIADAPKQDQQVTQDEKK